MIRILPTDTCYGLSGDFTDEDFYEIYRLKGRSFEKRLAVVVRDFSMLADFADISPEQITFLKSYPYPWSVILPRKSNERYPSVLLGEEYEYISFRVASVIFHGKLDPDHLDFPLFLTSANRSGESESATLDAALEIFQGVQGIDGGICLLPPSDIFRFGSDRTVEYVRRNHR